MCVFILCKYCLNFVFFFFYWFKDLDDRKVLWWIGRNRDKVMFILIVWSKFDKVCNNLFFYDYWLNNWCNIKWY